MLVNVVNGSVGRKSDVGSSVGTSDRITSYTD
jgi:hypothetical protein